MLGIIIHIARIRSTEDNIGQHRVIATAQKGPRAIDPTLDFEKEDVKQLPPSATTFTTI